MRWLKVFRRATLRGMSEGKSEIDPLARLVQVRMPYGKYKDTLLADLPGNYLNWFAREGFPSGELGRLLALMHEIDHNGLRELLRPLREGRTG